MPDAFHALIVATLRGCAAASRERGLSYDEYLDVVRAAYIRQRGRRADTSEERMVLAERAWMEAS